MKTEKLKNYLILDLTKNEKDLLNDLFIYMVDYIHDPCFTKKDRKTFDHIYIKLQNIDLPPTIANV